MTIATADSERTATVIMGQLIDDMMTQRKELMGEELQERRKDRRHKNMRFGLIFAAILITVLTYMYMIVVLGVAGVASAPSGPYAAIVQLKGPIADGEPANAVAINKALARAFRDPRAKGVVLYINSPGGSPVQSSIIYDRIIALKSEYPEKPIVAVATDTVASGAYFIASAADKIYVNRSTITGSIGVISDGFGFAGALERFGIERRVFTAGTNKSRLDQFTPLSDADTNKIHQILGQMHAHFIESVKNGRGDRLRLDTEGLFEGDVWTGGEALDIGLVDGLGDLTTVLATEFDVDHARDYTIKPAFLERLMRYAVSSTIDEITGYDQHIVR